MSRYIYSMECTVQKRGGNADTRYTMGEPQKHDAQWEKPSIDHILYDSILMKRRLVVAWSGVGIVNGHEGANEVCVKISKTDLWWWLYHLIKLLKITNCNF